MADRLERDGLIEEKELQALAAIWRRLRTANPDLRHVP